MNCLTLQYFINNVSTTINKSENGDTNVTFLYFMPGNHDVHFTKRVDITGPAILNGMGGDVTIIATVSMLIL